VWFEAPLAYQAKVGLRELRSQKAKDDCRIGIAERYRAELETQGPRGNRESISVYWQFIVVQENAIRFRKYLNSRAIDCATTSLVNISELEYYGFNFNLPGTKKLYETGVYLPCYHQLTPREQSRIIEAVKGFCEQPE
jgi:dTDP-4-amino-4,6-dideoxygalactose transaminase